MREVLRPIPTQANTRRDIKASYTGCTAMSSYQRSETKINSGMGGKRNSYKQMT